MICNSGGALGADTIFEEECIKHGIDVISWSFQGHNTKSPNRVNLTKEDLQEGWDHIIEANYSLNRNIKYLKPYVRNLLARNWFQVKNTDTIFAVAHLDGDNKVSGGTGWCCMMGIDNHKSVYVFDSKFNSWFSYNYSNFKFEKCDGVPKLTEKFAGVGSREIDEFGINAIKNLFKNIKI